tara:strand:+ start:769 stop:978 length:210 start_codon:yes stop_codon:yes gene_type:complete
MKFLLLIVICSSITKVCTPPKETNIYPSWFECSSNGYKEAYRLNQKIGNYMVNNKKVYINFQCKVVDNI